MHAIKLLATAALTIASNHALAARPESAGAFTITGVAKDPPTRILYYQVNSAADLDRDGRPDMGILKLVCAGGEVVEAGYRYHEWQWNNASGAKRQHKPVTFVKEWGPASSAMKAVRPGYDIKTIKARLAGGVEHQDDWHEVALTGGSDLCPAGTARGGLNSSKSDRATGPAFAIEGLALDPPASVHLVRVASGDIDGDGVADEGIVRLVCQGADLIDAGYSPRDSASGLATGKRMHKPMTIVKEWGPATPQLAVARGSYDLKKNEGAREAGGGEEWIRARLESDKGICADLARATSKPSIANIR